MPFIVIQSVSYRDSQTPTDPEMGPINEKSRINLDKDYNRNSITAWDDTIAWKLEYGSKYWNFNKDKSNHILNRRCLSTRKKLRKYFKLRPHEVDSSEINTLTTELSVEMSYFIRIHIICQSRPSYHLKYNELQKNGN